MVSSEFVSQSQRISSKAIIRENHKAPTLQEIAHILTGATWHSQKWMETKLFFGMHLTEQALQCLQHSTRISVGTMFSMCSIQTKNESGHLSNADG